MPRGLCCLRVSDSNAAKQAWPEGGSFCALGDPAGYGVCVPLPGILQHALSVPPLCVLHAGLILSHVGSF